MKKLSTIGVVMGAAVLSVAPFSLRVSPEKSMSLSLDTAGAVIGHPLTPMSIAGVHRRAERRAYRRGYYSGAYGGNYGYGTYSQYGYGAYHPYAYQYGYGTYQPYGFGYGMFNRPWNNYGYGYGTYQPYRYYGYNAYRPYRGLFGYYR